MKEKHLFFLCWLVYFTSYLGRFSYSYAMPSLLSLKILQYGDAGIPNFLFFLVYGIGQVINGYLGDRIDPRWMIFGGLFFSGLCNGIMPLCDSLFAMAFVWAVNGYLQSMIWPSLMHVIAYQFSEDKRQGVSLDIISSLVVGNIVSLFASSFLLKYTNWKWVYFFASIPLVLVGMYWLVAYPSGSKSAPVHNNGTKTKVSSDLRWQTGLSFIVVPIMIHGIIKDGVMSWIPTYYTTKFLLSPSMSLLVMVAIPLFKLSGAYITKALGKRIQDKFLLLRVLWGCMVLAMFLFCRLTNSLWLNCLFLSVCASLIMAINAIYINIIPLHYERVAFVSGFFNAIAYLGSAIASYAIGLLMDTKGWTFITTSWFFLTAVALLFSFIKPRNKTIKQ